MAQKVTAIMIVEIAGRPADHVKSALESHVGQLKQIKWIDVHSIEISEPAKVEDKDFFTCFAEVEFTTESFGRLTEIIYDFMPSSIEIVEPATIEFDAQEATEFANNLSGRLHRFDEIVKITQAQAQQILFRMKEAEQKLSEYEKNSPEKKTTTKKISKKKAKKSKK